MRVRYQATAGAQYALQSPIPDAVGRPMKRTAIYARFSTDLQNERSIDDQIALCRAYAARQGYVVVATFDDRGVSGASMHRRPGIKRLLAAAADGHFDVVLAEMMSRIGRDLEDRASIRKRLTFAGIQIVTPSDGLVSPLTDSIRAVIDSQQLEDTKGMIRRGMAGVIREGRHAGGRAYGYRPVKGEPGKLAIVEQEAEILRRIFAEYVAGRTPREIARDLNHDGIPPPRGDCWNASTLNGNFKRGHGILANELYVGVIVWNRVRMMLHPDTGRRISRSNPPTEWQRTPAPELRIIDDATWSAAQARKAKLTRKHPSHARRAKHLLSGLLKCGCCGGGMSVKDREHGRIRIVCTRSRESGICDNRAPVYLDSVERTALDGLRDELRQPRRMARYVKTYNAERRRLASDSVGAREKIEAQQVRVQRELDRAVTALVKGYVEEREAAGLIASARAERDRLAAELEQTKPAPVIALHPVAMETYHAAVDTLERTIADGAPEDVERTHAAVRQLIEGVIVHPRGDGGGMEIDVIGRISELVQADGFFLSDGIRQGGLTVADLRYHHPPCRARPPPRYLPAARS